jgi:hypothetical protein
MTSERAYEILRLGAKWCNWGKFCTEEENAFVMEVWDKMPGHTCWYDALVRIAKGKI